MMTAETKGILENRMTPFALKMIVDSSSKYRRAYKSYAFGLIHKIGSKWLIITIAAVAGIIVLLMLTGNLNIG
jgi:hypothetical protein